MRKEGEGRKGRRVMEGRMGVEGEGRNECRVGREGLRVREEQREGWRVRGRKGRRVR